MEAQKSQCQNDFPCITAEDKCISLFKRYRCSCSDCLFYALNKINEKQALKIKGKKFINTRNIAEMQNIQELTSQQCFPKFMQLQGVTQLLFYMLLIKLKTENLRLLNTIGVSCKVSDITVKNDEKFIRKIVCYHRKKEQSLTQTRAGLHKQMKTKLFRLYHQKKSRCCKLLSVFTIKFFTRQELMKSL